MSNLNRIEKDILREIGNIGAGRAAHNLAKFVHQEVSMSLPYLDKISGIDKIFERLKENFNLNIDNYSMTYSSMDEKEDYLLFSLMPINSCIRLVDLSLHEKVSNKEDFELPLVRSMLKEVGEIILVAYVDALNKFVSLNDLPNPCKIDFGTTDELLERYKSQVRTYHSDIMAEEELLFINLSIWVLEEDIAAFLGLIPLNDTVKRYVDKLDLGA